MSRIREKDEILVPLERLHRAYMGRGLAETLAKRKEPKERIRYTADFMERTTGLTGAGEYLTLLLELDAFFLNEDRHTNNLAVIRNEKTMEFQYCPVFDNGLALLADLNFPQILTSRLTRRRNCMECSCIFSFLKKIYPGSWNLPENCMTKKSAGERNRCFLSR